MASKLIDASIFVIKGNLYEKSMYEKLTYVKYEIKRQLKHYWNKGN